MSDLHMEFAPWDFEPEPDTFYVCAGDIDSNFVRCDAFLKKHSGHMFHVFGNHDFYGQSCPSPEVGMYGGEMNGVSFAGATLWTSIGDAYTWKLYKESLADGKFISDMTLNKYLDMHETHKRHLFESEADVVVSHHAPCFKSIHPKYHGSVLNEFFYTELSDIILNMSKPPKLWVHGHVHNECDYMIGSTRVVCHPRGYPGENEWFDTYQPKILEI